VTRGLSPVVGTVLLVAIIVALAGLAGAAVIDSTSGELTPHVRLSVDADAGADRIALTHESGDTLSTEEVSVRVSVDGQPLTYQPPVPFFAAQGFRGGPTGPFNPSADPDWSAGETAELRLASTNAPLLDPASTVTVTVSTDRDVIAELETKVE
jgi:flagellin-like protein